MGTLDLFVTKKDKSLRISIDYRLQNMYTVRNHCPFPRIDDSFDQFNGLKWFSKIDLRFSNHQLRVQESYIPKTTNVA